MPAQHRFRPLALAITTLLCAFTALATPAFADDSPAETCVRAKVWDGYGQGWAVRTLTSADLAPGKTKNFVVTLYAGNQYMLRGCGDEAVSNLDILLYDAQGELVSRDSSEGREPELSITPTVTATYYAVLYVRGRKDGGAAPAGVALAITYK